MDDDLDARYLCFQEDEDEDHQELLCDPAFEDCDDE